MLTRLFGCGGLCLSMMLSADLGASEADVVNLLADMVRSQRERTYQGVFVYEQGAKATSIEVYHGVWDGVAHERYVQLDGDEAELIRTGDNLIYTHSGVEGLQSRHVSMAPALVGHHDIDITAAVARYIVEKLPDQRVGGHKTHVVEFRPRDDYRYGQQLYIDVDSRLLLKSVIFDANRRIIERFRFVKLEDAPDLKGGDFSSRLTVPHPSVATNSRDAPSELGRSWEVAWLPEGFVPLEDASTPSRQPVKRTFKDGLAVFSVVMEADERVSAVQGSRMQQGATLVYSRGLVTPVGRFRVTVVGDIPEATAERVAASVRVLQ